MIYVTGDLHRTHNYKKLWPSRFVTCSADYLIIAGDFGGVWDGGEADQWIQNWFKKQPFTTLFVDGNHENYQLLKSYPIKEWNGGKVRQINRKVFHLMRGQVFNIGGKKFFTMGGATSIDKHLRLEGVSWWKEELPSKEEYDEALKNLEKHDYCVDYIITHTIKTDIIKDLGFSPRDENLNDFFDKVSNEVNYKHWYFGHFHIDKDINNKHTALYDRIIKIK